MNQTARILNLPVPPPLRVLHVISSLDSKHGGTTAAFLAMATAQREIGIAVSAVSTFRRREDLTAVHQLRAHSIPTEGIGPASRILLWHASIGSRLREMIKSSDVVHIHGLWEEIQYRAAGIAADLKVPCVVTPHGMLDPWSLSQSAFKKRWYLKLRMRRHLDRAAAIHFTDDVERDLAAGMTLQAPALVERLIIDLQDFRPIPPAGAFKKRHPELSGRRIILFMSRLHPKKGLDLLIPAFARVYERLRNSVLVLAGPCAEDYRKTLETMAKEHGIFHAIVFPGMISGRARAEALADADLFVLPSWQENFGIAVVEALAVGVPVIISDKVGIHRLIQSSGSGAVVANDAETLARTLVAWMSDDLLRKSASDNGIRFVNENFDRQRTARNWLRHYRHLIARGGAAQTVS